MDHYSTDLLPPLFRMSNAACLTQFLSLCVSSIILLGTLQIPEQHSNKSTLYENNRNRNLWTCPFVVTVCFLCFMDVCIILTLLLYNIVYLILDIFSPSIYCRKVWVFFVQHPHCKLKRKLKKIFKGAKSLCQPGQKPLVSLLDIVNFTITFWRLNSKS